MSDLSPLKTREDFKKRYEQVYPDTKPGAIPVSAGRLYRFVREMKIGDTVIFPLKRSVGLFCRSGNLLEPVLEAEREKRSSSLSRNGARGRLPDRSCKFDPRAPTISPVDPGQF